MKRVLALTVLFAVPAYGASDERMAKAVEGFYNVHQTSDQDGIPDAGLRARYAPYLSRTLARLLTDAAGAQARFAKDHADAPPLLEGDMFSPNFEGITTFKVSDCTGEGQSGRCTVALHYAAKNPAPRDKPIDWNDTIYLVNDGGSWRVDDIAFGGNWDFGNHGRLSAELKEVSRTVAP